MKRNIPNFADVITCDNVEKMVRGILGGRRYIISPGISQRSTSRKYNQCLYCCRKIVLNEYYCFNHLKKISKKLSMMLLRDIKQSTPVERCTIKQRIATIYKNASTITSVV